MKVIRPKMKDYGIQSFKAFATAYNILTLTNYSGQDPEVGYTGTNPFSIGQDWSKTPKPVSITAGVSIVF